MPTRSLSAGDDHIGREGAGDILTTDSRRWPAALSRAPAWASFVAVPSALAIGLGARSRPSFAVVMIAIAFAAAGVAAVIDVRERRIPDQLVLAVAAPSFAVAIAEAAGGFAGPVIVAALAGAALFAGPLLVAHLAQPAAIGFGDVKLGAALGAIVGLADWRWSMLAICIASGSTAAIGLAVRARSLPFAPGLVAGSVAALVVHAATGGVLLPWH